MVTTRVISISACCHCVKLCHMPLGLSDRNNICVIMLKVTRMNGTIMVVIIQYCDDFQIDQFKIPWGVRGSE